MDVAVSEFRAELRHWLDEVRQGEEVVILDRGLPVARVIGVASTPAIERLTAEGVISRPKANRRPKASALTRVKAARPVSDHISEGRR